MYNAKYPLGAIRVGIFMMRQHPNFYAVLRYGFVYVRNFCFICGL